MDGSGSEDQEEAYRRRDQTHSYEQNRQAPPYPNITSAPRTSALTTAATAGPRAAVNYTQNSRSEYLGTALYPYARLNEQHHNEQRHQRFSPWPYQHSWIPPTASPLPPTQNYTENVYPGFVPHGAMHSQPPRQSWMQRPVGNRSAENPEFLTHAPRIHHQSSTVSRRTVLERQRQPRFPPSIQGSATGRSMSDSSPGRDPILQSRIQQLQEELSFCRDEWVIVCIILSLLRSSFYSVKAQSPRSVAASAAAPLSLDPQSASLKSEENDPPGVRVLESRTNVPMSSSTLQREGGRATPPPPELFATTIPDLRSEHFVPEYDFTAFKTSTFLVARASQRQPSTSQHSRSKCKTKRKKKQHPTRKQEEQQASSSTRETGIQQEMSNAIKHDLERELLMAYDDLWLQIRNLEAKIERVEEMIRRMITSNGMTPPSEGL